MAGCACVMNSKSRTSPFWEFHLPGRHLNCAHMKEEGWRVESFMAPDRPKLGLVSCWERKLILVPSGNRFMELNASKAVSLRGGILNVMFLCITGPFLQDQPNQLAWKCDNCLAT